LKYQFFSVARLTSLVQRLPSYNAKSLRQCRNFCLCGFSMYKRSHHQTWTAESVFGDNSHQRRLQP